MAKPQPTDVPDAPAFELLAHLEQAFGWSEARALDALGQYLLGTAAGERLRRELESTPGAARAA